jgi:hypothetical protein
VQTMEIRLRPALTALDYAYIVVAGGGYAL